MPVYLWRACPDLLLYGLRHSGQGCLCDEREILHAFVTLCQFGDQGELQ